MAVAVKRGRKLRSDVLITLVFALLKALAVLWSIRLAESLYPAVLLGIYLLSRRVASTLPALTALGVSNTLQRYVPLGGDEPRTNVPLLFAGVVLTIAVNALVFLIYVLLGRSAPGLLLPDTGGYDGLRALALWTLIQCALIALHFVLIGALVGKRRMLAANVVDLLVIGGWQILAFSYYGAGASPVIVTRFQALAMIVTTLPGLALLFLREKSAARLGLSLPERSVWKVFLTYGATRGGVTFLDALLVTQGPWLLRNRPAEIGYLIVALTIPRLVVTALSSVNSVASVAAAGLLGREDHHGVKVGVNMAIGLVTSSAVLAAAVLAPFVHPLLGVWLTTASAIHAVESLAPYLLIVLPAVALFHGLKGIVDVQDVFPYNLINLVIANLIMWLGYELLRFVVGPLLAVVIAFGLSSVVLAGSTLFVLRRWLMDFWYFTPGRLVVTAAGAWLICAAIARTVGQPDRITTLAIATITMGIAFAAGVWVLVRSSRGLFAADLMAFVLRGSLPSEFSAERG